MAARRVGKDGPGPFLKSLSALPLLVISHPRTSSPESLPPSTLISASMSNPSLFCVHAPSEPTSEDTQATKTFACLYC
ncbi:hypothetical protein QJS10_CPB17g01814 [Acorus calamus]|uniref:Uncharacterized protein n=1 Tax=Acorus calamus TaxID=4465 RepID=A0AAV9CUN0_ACOCL|nr:hypothetical protein QJS10_CPB17g01814 [Acorus calamus]